MLSDYEAMGRLPRHIAKILSLCVVYCMDVWELMEAAGVHVDDSAKLPLLIPDGASQFAPTFCDDPRTRNERHRDQLRPIRRPHSSVADIANSIAVPNPAPETFVTTDIVTYRSTNNPFGCMTLVL